MTKRYRLAYGLETLRAEIDEASPGRDRRSDGWIGNAEHAARSSDHNPWMHDHNGQPVVTAIDITNDPSHGVGGGDLAAMLVRGRDPRIKYIIWNHRIMAGAAGPAAWGWRPYHGANGHEHHVHISIEKDEAKFDSREPWNLDLGVTHEHRTAPPVVHAVPVLRPGSDEKEHVRILQRTLLANGFTGLRVDGVFGPTTESAVRHYQMSHGLHQDGVVGDATWAKLGIPLE